MTAEQKRMEQAMIPFEFKGDLNKFEKAYLPKLKKIDLADEFQARNLLSAIWLFSNSEWSKGKEWAYKNPRWQPKNTNILRRIRSKFTMKYMDTLFRDKVNGRLVNKYVDAFGTEWMAQSKFGYRIPYNNEP